MVEILQQKEEVEEVRYWGRHWSSRVHLREYGI